jgi:drug/metabolite transporter (DMT)-like permease
MCVVGEAEYVHWLGASAALGAAFFWALSSLLFRRAGARVSALVMNAVKGVVALLCLGAGAMVFGGVDADARSIVLLALSGVVGICLGDTLYFLALVRLGARRTLLMTTLVPVATAFAALLLGERPTVTSWFGVSLVLGAIAYVLWERAPSNDRAVSWRAGVLFAFVYVVAETVGILATKLGVVSVDAMDAALIRQFAASLGLGVWIAARGDVAKQLAPLRDAGLLAMVTGAGFLGAFLGIWLSVVALKYTYAAVAATLSGAAPLFVLPLAALLDRERISLGGACAALVAVCGLGVFFAGAR